MPLSRWVGFKVVLQKGNRVQVPKLVRWEFKLESSQVLYICVKLVGSYGSGECFFGRMNRDGRITIPKLTLGLLQDEADVESLVGHVLKVSLEPTGQQ
jgi:bifunctional DNA-binding transcriptional regulator/antitoxin component of YhaV-PrlF toxin-antitoxin module